LFDTLDRLTHARHDGQRVGHMAIRTSEMLVAYWSHVSKSN
jgi:hypothetical protein